MKKLILSILVATCVLCTGCATKEIAASRPTETTEKTFFIDDDGTEISVAQPYERIISLYSAHTENLYTLNAESQLIGVHDTSIYPPEAAFLPRFDYNGDPEVIIAANPDLVLIRPFISRKAPQFVEALRTAGITVVSLYPDTFEDFDDYIHKLALLTGKEEIAETKMIEFHQTIDAIQNQTAAISEKQTIFFESTEVELRTVTPDSMVGKAIEFAGGINIASHVQPMTKGSSIASFGAEKILAQADNIDVYVSQRGAMNAGGNEHSISIRPGFDTIKAIQNDRVFLLNEKIISSPTFRYAKGVHELARFLYPEIMDQLEPYEENIPAAKRDLANILMRYYHLPMYVTSSSKYYISPPEGHIYGMFHDVDWTDSDFDAIETVVQRGAIPWKEENGIQYFEPEQPVTREMLAKSIFLLNDIKSIEEKVSISDLESCENPKIVQTLVNHHIFDLIDGQFQPQKVVTKQEILHTLNKIK